MLVEIKFKIGEKEIVLTADEASKLYGELKKYFEPRNTEYVPYPVYPTAPLMPWPSLPWYRELTTIAPPYTITWSGTSNEMITIDANQLLSDGPIHIYAGN